METITLDNGLRIIADHRPGQVVYCGIAVAAGTRDQEETESGMAHLIEHMSFKGTRRRRAWHIINRMESVGGDLNAFTAKEHTVYYCSTLRKHLGRALELLLDITLHSTYPQRELEREVEVVCDEIESYNDSPSELIYDDFEGLLFHGHPLGRNILGDADRLRKYRTDDLRRFADRLYCPSRMVLFVLGDVCMRDVLRITGGERRPESGVENVWDAQNKFREDKHPLSAFHTMAKSTHQAHAIVGCRSCAMGDPRYMGLYLLNNILGGPGMNARLNLSLRERRGLVYTVESSLTAYTDCGVWATYFGCDRADVDKCLSLVGNELARLVDAPMSVSALAAAKRQLKGQMALSWENGESVAISMARRYLHMGHVVTLEDIYQQIDALTPSGIHDIARETFSPDRLVTLLYT